MTEDLRPRSFGEILALVFRLTGRHFAALLSIHAVCSLPSLGARFWMMEELRTRGSPSGEFLLVSGGVILALHVIVLVVASAACAPAVASSFTDRRMSAMAAIAVTLRRLPTVIGFTALFVLLGLTVVVVTGLPFVLGDLIVGPLGLSLLGAVSATAFACALVVRLFVGPCVSVLEDGSALRAMARSAELTRGRRWTVFGIFAVCAALAVVAQVLTQSIVLATVDMQPDRAPRIGGVPVVMLVTWFFAVVLWLPVVVAPTVTYVSLRAEKDGSDVARLPSLVDEIGRRGERVLLEPSSREIGPDHGDPSTQRG